MSEVSASCPGCGAGLVYRYSGLVVVCAHCRSAVARGDIRFEDLGKVSQVTQSQSALSLGLTGKYQSIPFTLCGRVQIKHSAGGTWEEWYAAFADGRWGWLAEAQGKLYMTFESAPQPLPGLSSLSPGGSISLAGIPGSFVVAEKGEAELIGAEGEIPYRVQPGARYQFADLSGPQGEFGTIDYRGASPILYLGYEVTLEQLGINAEALPPAPPREILAERLSCPNCGASLEMRAPDKTERVSCQYCASLLDVNQGALVFLKTLTRTGPNPRIDLGKQGKLQGKEFTVIGFLIRSVTVEGERYSWEEYLLYNPTAGFRWLVYNEGHWILVKTVPAGSVQVSASGATYKGRTFPLSETNDARVDFVLGEFYWKVEVGETVRVSDFTKKPNVLSREVNGNEVVWSYGTYMPRGTVERAFGLPVPPPPLTRMPYQPSSYSSEGKTDWTIWLGVILVIVFFIIPLLIESCESNGYSYSSSYSGGGFSGFGSGFRGGK